jgi:hypothetical protein
MRFDLHCSSMVENSTSARSNLSRLVLPIPLYLLLPLVFLRLDWFSWSFHRLDAKPHFKIKVFSAYYIGSCVTHCSTDSIPWVHT